MCQGVRSKHKSVRKHLQSRIDAAFLHSHEGGNISNRLRHCFIVRGILMMLLRMTFQDLA
jgi:hypothetical protein